jgi:hypothetical protein
MPACDIYDEDIVKAHKPILATCHIYIIGLMPTASRPNKGGSHKL